MMARRWVPRRSSILSTLVLAGLAGYAAWWAFFLAHGRLPPAPILVFTGLPAPTTGCTRSLLSLLHGDVAGSLAWNPLMVPLASLWVGSLATLAACWVRRRPLVLPRWVARLWLATLAAAWVVKLVSGPQYW